MTRLNDLIDIPTAPGEHEDEYVPPEEESEEGAEISAATEPGVPDPFVLEGWFAFPVDAGWLENYEPAYGTGVAILSGPPENGEDDISEIYATAPVDGDSGEESAGVRRDLEVEEAATFGGAVPGPPKEDFICYGPLMIGMKRDEPPATIEGKSPVHGESGGEAQAVRINDADRNDDLPLAEPLVEDLLDLESMNEELLDAYVLMVDDGMEIA